MMRLSGLVKKELDEFYHQPKWKSLRKSILVRDKYMCQRCKDKGLMREAEHVHHIFPREQYHEYEYCRWNLISLCYKCHNEMHNRFNGELSQAGLRLLKTTAIMNDIPYDMTNKTILIVGLRGSGKSTYARKHLDDDSLVYDMDAIASAFRLRMPHDEYFKPARKMANDFLGGFLAKAHEYVKTIYIIRTAPTIREFEQINPSKIVFCMKSYEYRDMDDREGAADRIHTLKEYAETQGIEVDVID